MSDIPQRPFGSTGLMVPALGLGGGQLGDARLPEAQAERLVHLAVDLGVTLFDTARGYGESEARLGRYLGPRRKQVVLSTKVGYGVPGERDWTHGAVASGVDDALRRLNTDWIDVVHLHSCLLETLQEGAVITALEDARQAGKIRAAAYSGENEALAYALETGRFQGLQTSINLADQRSLQTVVPRAAERGLGIIAKRPAANAPWRFEERPYGHYVEEYWYRWNAMGLDPRGLPWQAAALRFAAYLPGVACAIAGTANPEHLRQNAEFVAQGPLPPDQVEEIRRAFREHDEDWTGLT